MNRFVLTLSRNTYVFYEIYETSDVASYRYKKYLPTNLTKATMANKNN